MTYDDLVYFAQSWGLIYLMAIFVGALIYALWPSNKRGFDRAAQQPLNEDDGPWR